jgi:hypothetical protein
MRPRRGFTFLLLNHTLNFGKVLERFALRFKFFLRKINQRTNGTPVTRIRPFPLDETNTGIASCPCGDVSLSMVSLVG